MTFKKLINITCLTLIALMTSGAFAQDKVDFVKQIKPIIENHCVSCHGPENEEAFRIDVRDDALYYIEAGDAEESQMYQVLVSDDEEELMPPKETDEGDPITPLTSEQIALVKTWINEGAEWPEDVQLVDTAPKPDVEPKEGEDKVDPKTQQIYNAIGSLHPAAIHLPIGLLLASGLFALFSLRGNFVMSDCAYYCLWLGTIGAIVACATGWWFSPMETRGEVNVFADLLDQTHPVFWHRTGGLIVTAVAFLLALFAAGARNRDPDDGMMWKLGLILHYGESHYKDLNAVYQGLVNPAPADPKAEKDSPTAESESDEDNSEIGEVTGELKR